MDVPAWIAIPVRAVMLLIALACFAIAAPVVAAIGAGQWFWRTVRG